MNGTSLDAWVLPPQLSPASRALVRELASDGAGVGAAGDVAKRLGLSSRFRLARILKQDGIPPLHELSGWFAVLRWVRAAEQNAASLCRVAIGSHRDPAACYRLVKRITGRTWNDVRAMGSEWVQARLAELLHAERRLERAN